MKRNVQDLPWLIGGLGMFFNGIFTLKVIRPKAIDPLLDPNLLKDNGKLIGEQEKN